MCCQTTDVLGVYRNTVNGNIFVVVPNKITTYRIFDTQTCRYFMKHKYGGSWGNDVFTRTQVLEFIKRAKGEKLFVNNDTSGGD